MLLAYPGPSPVIGNQFSGVYSISVPCTLHQTLTACIDCHQVAKKWLVIKMSDLRGLVTLLRKVGPIHHQSSRTIFKHHTFPPIHHGSSRKLHTGNTTSFIYQPFSHYSRSSSQKGEKRLKFPDKDNDQTKDVQMPEAKQDQLSELQHDFCCSLVLCPAESTLCLLLSLIYNARTILCSPKNLHPASHPSSQKLLSTLFLLFSAS